jgi:hypothetical protein
MMPTRLWPGERLLYSFLRGQSAYARLYVSGTLLVGGMVFIGALVWGLNA